jgi:hypothetical protein
VQSDWVEHEIRLAQKIESSLHEEILCPISLDSAWTTSSWKHRLLEHVPEERILSFADWRNEEVMEQQFDTLVQGIAPFHTVPSANP